MGYPTEIANAMPRQQPVPVEDPFTRALRWLAERWRRLWRRRRRTRADFPPIFGQGVDPRWPVLRREDARQIRSPEPGRDDASA